MKFLILNTDYPEFLLWLYSQHPELENKSYQEQMQTRNESLFGVANFYSENLRKLGHEAWDIHFNNRLMQKAWAKEQGIQARESISTLQEWRRLLRRGRRAVAKTPIRYFRSLFPRMSRALVEDYRWFYDVLAAQIKYYDPDVLLNQDMVTIDAQLLRKMKPYTRLLVGQIASPLPQKEDYACYDLVISSLPNYVEYFRRIGVPSSLHKLAFEPRVLSMLDSRRPEIPVSFVGNLSQYHRERVHLLEHLCTQLSIGVWGPGLGYLPSDSPIHKHYMGQAWGIEMYRILSKSRIVVNQHSNIAESYANNMRLFEATGVGTLLVTDWKVNLHEMFEPGKEVVVYGSPEECAELTKYYLEHDKEREAIARAGQQRTLLEHTYYQRMHELEEIVDSFLSSSRVRGFT